MSEVLDSTRDRLLQAAERLFARQGYEATSVRDITAAAECNVASVNYHFGGKNKLYLAMRELGRVVRTVFLLEYLGDAELRRTINAATNKSESFHDFTKWLAFGGDRTIRENDRDKQRKLIKFNQLVANCLILHNVQSMSRILHDLAEEGHDVGDDILASLSPYGTEHVNRFGKHILDMDRKPTALDYEWRGEAPLEPEFVG